MPKFVFPIVPEEGDVMPFYTRAQLSVGEEVTISHPVGSGTGRVVTDHGATEQFVSPVVDMSAPGYRAERNLGQGYYDIQVTSVQFP